MTFNLAKYLAREKDLGTVEKGNLADLVLLDADLAQGHQYHHEDWRRKDVAQPENASSDTPRAR